MSEAVIGQLSLFALPPTTAESLTDWLLSRCNSDGVCPRAVVIELKLREVQDFLNRLSPMERQAFVVTLLDRNL